MEIKLFEVSFLLKKKVFEWESIYSLLIFSSLLKYIGKLFATVLR